MTAPGTYSDSCRIEKMIRRPGTGSERGVRGRQADREVDREGEAGDPALQKRLSLKSPIAPR